jgi:hypothetical protein
VIDCVGVTVVESVSIPVVDAVGIDVIVFIFTKRVCFVIYNNLVNLESTIRKYFESDVMSWVRQQGYAH